MRKNTKKTEKLLKLSQNIQKIIDTEEGNDIMIPTKGKRVLSNETTKR